MQTTIVITGQISGNRTLLNAIPHQTVRNLPFYGYAIDFNTKKEATEALSNARIALKEDKEDWDSAQGSYVRGVRLNWDASKAKIIQR